MNKLTKVQILQDLDLVNNLMKFDEDEANFAKSKGIRKLLDAGRITVNRLIDIKRILTNPRANLGHAKEWQEPRGQIITDIKEWIENKGNNSDFRWALQQFDSDGNAIVSNSLKPGDYRVKCYVLWGNPEDGDILSTVWVDVNRGQVRCTKNRYQKDTALVALTKSGKLLFRDR